METKQTPPAHTPELAETANPEAPASPHPTQKHNHPKPKASSQVPWSGFVGIVYAAAVYFAAQFVASVVVILYSRMAFPGAEAAERWLTEAVTAQFWYVLVAEVLTFAAIVWFVKKRGSTLAAIGWRRIRWKDFGYALLGFMGYFLLYGVLLAVVSQLVPSLDLEQEQDIGFEGVSSNLSLILTFISLVILPPLVEELVFRGFVFGGLKNKLPVVVAALVTSVLFAVAHLQFGNGQPLLWVAALDTFVLSMVLCYLRQRTGSLWAGIVIHAMKNGVAFLYLFVLTA
jgi:membrane protease YdiL (CAAX protease family)